MDGVNIRIAKPSDAEALLSIYAPYVRNTAITFEYEVPTVSEFEERIRHTQLKYPYIVAEENGKIIGYAYAGVFKDRAAYDRAVEVSVYVDKNLHSRGVGKQLYTKLEEILRKQNILSVNACIAYPECEDGYLDKNSAEFHRHMGYKTVGEFHKCGYKFGRWYNMIWMEKHIGEFTDNPKAVIWFSDLKI